MTIRNPIEWGVDQIESTAHVVKQFGYALHPSETNFNTMELSVRRIGISDLRDVLSKGVADFAAYRTDVIFLCLIYPVVGLILAKFTLDAGLLPLLFPLISGFALLGPFAAAGVYEMSRRQEQGRPVKWIDAFGVFGSPSIVAIIKLALLITGIFLLWLATAMVIYRLTIGSAETTSIVSFLTDIFTKPGGLMLIAVGVSVGFLFAVAVLAISVVSFPLLLDRRVPISTAISTSIRVFILNPIPILAWGFIVAASLVIGMIPVFVGLIVVIPILGHATWHLYRRTVV